MVLSRGLFSVLLVAGGLTVAPPPCGAQETDPGTGPLPWMPEQGTGGSVGTGGGTYDYGRPPGEALSGSDALGATGDRLRSEADRGPQLEPLDSVTGAGSPVDAVGAEPSPQ